MKTGPRTARNWPRPAAGLPAACLEAACTERSAAAGGGGGGWPCPHPPGSFSPGDSSGEGGWEKDEGVGAVSEGERQSPGLQTKFLGGGWAGRWWEVGAIGKAGNVLRTTHPPF